MSFKFGKPQEFISAVESKLTIKHYKIISIVLGALLLFAGIGAIYEATVRGDLHTKIQRQATVIADTTAEKQAIQKQLSDLTAANEQAIADLKKENNDSLAAFAKQAASCDEIKKRFGFK